MNTYIISQWHSDSQHCFGKVCQPGGMSTFQCELNWRVDILHCDTTTARAHSIDGGELYEAFGKHNNIRHTIFTLLHKCNKSYTQTC